MKVLLHVCCANCAIYPVKVMREEGLSPDGFFFNHNIHPYQEFARRLDTVRQYAAMAQLNMIYREDYLLETFLSAVAQAPQSRCDYCYIYRLEETAKRAKELGYKGFSTSLLYSRYQNHDQIRAQGEELAERYGLSFIYADYRCGWQEGIQDSKQMGLYRQQYCGCIYSEKDRYCPKGKD